MHIREVEAVIVNWAGNGYRISEETDGNGTTTLFAEILKPLPDILPLVIGDALHCMRSSLDQLIFSLAMDNCPGLTPEQQGGTSFPIKDDAINPTNLPGGIAHIKRVAQIDVIDLGPDPKRQALDQDALWLLNKVENRDKHRDVLVTTAVAGLDTYCLIQSDGTDFFRIFGPKADFNAGRVRVCEFRRSPGVKAQISLSCEARFDPSTEVKNRVVIETLWWMHDHIRDTVFQRLEQHF